MKGALITYIASPILLEETKFTKNRIVSSQASILGEFAHLAYVRVAELEISVVRGEATALPVSEFNLDLGKKGGHQNTLQEVYLTAPRRKFHFGFQ